MLTYNSKSLLKIGNSSYKFLNDLLPILLYETDNIFLHNTRQIKNQNEIISKNTFEGSFSCGASCYLLKYFFERNDIPTRIIYSKIGYGKYFEDHCFLKYADYIIDPTYRQMFSGKSLETDNYLFQKLPWIFIGKYNKLEEISDTLSTIKKTNPKVSENLYFWKHPEENSNNILPLVELMNTGKFREMPDECFETLYYQIKSNENKYF